MSSLPAEILFGIYLGLLVGTIPALVAWSLGFVFKYVTGVTLPGFGVMILAVGLAGVNGGLLALIDPAISTSPNAPSVVTAIVVVSMLSLYAHSQGDAMAVDFPRRLSLSKLRSKTISRDLAELVSGGKEVRIRVVGEVADMEGYPPLSEELRGELRRFEATFPADLRIDELQERLGDRLKTEFDLGDVSVDIDERGRATVVAAPPFSGLSKRITDGRHAVSIDGLIPTGLARGDDVTIIAPDTQARGTVVSAQSDKRTDGRPGADEPIGQANPDPIAAELTDSEERTTPVRAPTTTGGNGRVTVAVNRTDVQPLLRAREAKVVVESRGLRREYEVVSMIRRADRRFRRLVISSQIVAGTTVGTLGDVGGGDISVLAVRKPDGWKVGPRGATSLESGDEVFVVGTRESLESLGRSVT